MSSPFMEVPRETLERLFAEGMAAAQAGRLPEAADKLDQLVALEPAIPDVYWNLGTWRAQMQQHDRALVAWDAYRALVPDDWRGRAKVIQSCQALGDTARRDRERDELLALRKAGSDPALTAEPHYCIEQFRVGDQPVVAYEVFEPAGEMRVLYVFLVGQSDGTMIGRYSLGSYDFTTNLAREQGRLGPDERIYHLDWYAGPLHATQGFYSVLPSYDQVRADVVAALTETRPGNYSVRADPGNQPDAGRSESPSSAAPAPPAPTPPASRGVAERLSSWAARLMGRRDDRAN